MFRAWRQQGQRLGGVTTWYIQEVSGTVWLEEEVAWVGQTVSPGVLVFGEWEPLEVFIQGNDMSCLPFFCFF